MNDPLDERMRTQSPISYFFYKLLYTPRPNFKTASDREKFMWAVKYFSGLWYIKLKNKYDDFISWLTQYYPFSLFYQTRLFHAWNLPARDFMVKLEDVARKAHKDIAITDGQAEVAGVDFYGYFHGRTKNKDRALQVLEKVLQKEFGSIYVRDHEAGFRILIPTELLEENQTSDKIGI